MKLKDRIEIYQNNCDFKLLNRLPFIVVVNGRSFSKVTNLVDKPYCPKLAECLSSTLMKLCLEIEGSVFGYQYSDEIVIIVNGEVNDNGWYNNRIQKITSITSSIATLHFNRCASAIELNLMSEAIFSSQVFAVPSIIEAINLLIFKQQHNFYTSIQFACFYELLKKYDKNTIFNKLRGLNVEEKGDLLLQECGINFSNYPLAFKRGVTCFKANKIEHGSIKNKWVCDENIPIFTEESEYLNNIIKNNKNISLKYDLF